MSDADKYHEACAENMARTLNAIPDARLPKYTERWRTKDGRVLTVDEMSEDHVRATLNMILGNRRRDHERKSKDRAERRIQRWMDAAIDEDRKWGNS